MEFKRTMRQWQASFFAGLALLTPAVISIALLVWLFGTVSNITDTLLFFLPKEWVHRDRSDGPIWWYWSLVSLVMALVVVSLMGQIARYYLGKKLFRLIDELLLRVPLLNKIYSTIKQVNDAFTSTKKSSFKQVVMVEYPRDGVYSVGFVTSEGCEEFTQKTGVKTLSVFVPTTPNPTSGFLVLVPEAKVVKLDMSIADGIKFIVSLGSIAPDPRSPAMEPPAATGK
jgi:uncharacterized membrane protein